MCLGVLDRCTLSMSFIIFISKDLFHGIDKIPLLLPMKQTPKTEACKPAICLPFFFKLGVTLLSWSPPYLRACFSDEKEYQNRLRNTHTVQNKRNESNACTEVPKKTPTRKAASKSESVTLPFGHVSLPSTGCTATTRNSRRM